MSNRSVLGVKSADEQKFIYTQSIIIKEKELEATVQ